MKSRLHITGWLLFFLCGIIYLAASIRDRDPLMIAGTLFFVLGAAIFLFPGKKR